MNHLLNICANVLDILDFKINFSKSCCLRIGNRCKVLCQPFIINGNAISWAKEAKFLGLNIISGTKFNCDWHPARRKFFSSLNSILYSLGNCPSIQVALSLFRSVCLPVLTYGLTSLPLSHTEIHSFSFAYNNIFHKLFKTNNKQTIELCQYFCNFWPFSVWYDYLRFSFLADLFKRGLLLSNNLFDQSDFHELFNIASKYNFDISDSIYTLKRKVWHSLERLHL